MIIQYDLLCLGIDVTHLESRPIRMLLLTVSHHEECILRSRIDNSAI